MQQPFQINIDPAIITDLRKRLANTRWTNEINNENWQTGTNANYLKELCNYWEREYDWKKNEAYLNSFPHYKVMIDDTGIHYIHVKGEGSNSVPLLLIHGYPDSFVRYLKVIPLLTAADEHDFSFDLVIPSLPGYGFSDKPSAPGMNQQRMGELFMKLMTEELSYSRFMVHGGDWGSGIAEQMALNYPQHLHGIHLTDIPWYHLFAIPNDGVSEAEKKYMQSGQQWSQQEGGYAMILSTRPQSLGYALNDSPAGLAGWMMEKFYAWSDCNGNLETVYTKDELLTNLTIYWATQTINSANRLYHEAAFATWQIIQKKEIRKVQVPTGVAIFPKDMVPAPREFGNRLFNIQQWTEMPRGGHFTAMEQPELFAGDVRKFAKAIKVMVREEVDV